MDYYDGIAQGYDELYGAEQVEKLEHIAKILDANKWNVDPSWSLLDVGCGTGISTAFFDCARKVGVDPSEGLLKIARSKYATIEFRCVPAEEMLDDIEYDLVISLTAVQNFGDVEKGVRNMLKVGRRFIISVLKGSRSEESVRSLLLEEGFDEFDGGKDVVFLRF